MSSTAAEPPGRLRSVDLFRGAAVAGMILVNSQYSERSSYPQLAHSAWNGWTFADTIFPAFLFIVGVSIVISTAGRVARGKSDSELIVHILLRALIIFACGVAIDYVRIPVREFPYVALKPHPQLTGILQKIAVCYALAALIYLRAGLRGVIAGAIGLNVLYLALLEFYPVPSCAPGSLTSTCNFPGYFDHTVLKTFCWDLDSYDAGLGSLPSVTATVLFGVLAGSALIAGVSARKTATVLLFAGLGLIALGELMSTWIPLNKKVWTPSFAVLMAGLSTLGLAFSIWLVEQRRLGRLCRPLEFIGANALPAYLVSRLIDPFPRVHLFGWSVHDGLFARIASPANASLMYATLILLLVFAVLAMTDRRRRRIAA